MTAMFVLAKACVCQSASSCDVSDLLVSLDIDYS